MSQPNKNTFQDIMKVAHDMFDITYVLDEKKKDIKLVKK